jgi:hypothetical protein
MSRRGHNGESCPDAIRTLFNRHPGPHPYSQIKKTLHEMGTWKDSTIRRMIMSVIVNLPPAREEWSTDPFLLIRHDGTLELYDETTHGRVVG